MSLEFSATFYVAPGTTIIVDSHETGTRDITFRDTAGNKLTVAVDGDVELLRLRTLIDAFLPPAPVPPREPSATSHPQGTVIPNEGDGS